MTKINLEKIILNDCKFCKEKTKHKLLGDFHLDQDKKYYVGTLYNCSVCSDTCLINYVGEKKIEEYSLIIEKNYKK